MLVQDASVLNNPHKCISQSCTPSLNIPWIWLTQSTKWANDEILHSNLECVGLFLNSLSITYEFFCLLKGAQIPM